LRKIIKTIAGKAKLSAHRDGIAAEIISLNYKTKLSARQSGTAAKSLNKLSPLRFPEDYHT
jgi:hypothetical protein